MKIDRRTAWSPFRPLFFILTTLCFTFILARIFRSNLFDFIKCVKITYPENFQHPHFYTRWVNQLLQWILDLVFTRGGGAGNTVPTGATVFSLLMAIIIRSVDRMTTSFQEIRDGDLFRRTNDLETLRNRRTRMLVRSLSHLSPGLVALVFGFLYFHDLVLFKTYIAQLAGLEPVLHTLNRCQWWRVTPKLYAINDTWIGVLIGAVGTLVWILLIRLIWPRARLAES
jgi:hypothetical protein